MRRAGQADFQDFDEMRQFEIRHYVSFINRISEVETLLQRVQLIMLILGTPIKARLCLNYLRVFAF
jgi:hypothetical protein